MAAGSSSQRHSLGPVVVVVVGFGIVVQTRRECKCLVQFVSSDQFAVLQTLADGEDFGPSAPHRSRSRWVWLQCQVVKACHETCLTLGLPAACAETRWDPGSPADLLELKKTLRQDYGWYHACCLCA